MSTIAERTTRKLRFLRVNSIHARFESLIDWLEGDVSHGWRGKLLYRKALWMARMTRAGVWPYPYEPKP